MWVCILILVWLRGKIRVGEWCCEVVGSCGVQHVARCGFQLPRNLIKTCLVSITGCVYNKLIAWQVKWAELRENQQRNKKQGATFIRHRLHISRLFYWLWPSIAYTHVYTTCTHTYIHTYIAATSTTFCITSCWLHWRTATMLAGSQQWLTDIKWQWPQISTLMLLMLLSLCHVTYEDLHQAAVKLHSKPTDSGSELGWVILTTYNPCYTANFTSFYIFMQDGKEFCRQQCRHRSKTNLEVRWSRFLSEP